MESIFDRLNRLFDEGEIDIEGLKKGARKFLRLKMITQEEYNLLMEKVVNSNAD